jgi:uncharacterized FAD-dependent dehydrogenase
MKTSFFCLGLLIVALLVGKQQETRIQAAERLLGNARVLGRVTSPIRERDETGTEYRRKYTRLANSLTATEVYQTIVSLRKKRSAPANAGFGAVLDNKGNYSGVGLANITDLLIFRES